MMTRKRGLATSIMVFVFVLSFSVEVSAEQASAAFLVVTMKDGSSEVFNVPVDSDKVDSAVFAFSDAGLHELEGKHNLIAIINNVPITTGDFYDKISGLVGREVLSYIIDETLASTLESDAISLRPALSLRLSTPSSSALRAHPPCIIASSNTAATTA
jgi:hypothetical protein